MSNLSESSFARLREVTRAMVDPGSGVPEAQLDWAMTEMRQFAARAGGLTRLAVWGCLLFIQLLAPLLVLGKFKRFTSLPLPERTELLHLMESGRFVLLIVPVKAIVCMHYFEHPEVLAATGYDGKPLIEASAVAAQGAAR